jgi:hypothetical protein
LVVRRDLSSQDVGLQIIPSARTHFLWWLVLQVHGYFTKERFAFVTQVFYG